MSRAVKLAIATELERQALLLERQYDKWSQGKWIIPDYTTARMDCAWETRTRLLRRAQRLRLEARKK